MTVPSAVAVLLVLTLALPGNAWAEQQFFTGPIGPVRVPVTSYRDMPFRTVVRQQYDFSCGSAAVATLMHYHYGRATGEAEVFQAMFDRGDQARIRRDGFSMLDMKDYLDAAGLTTAGLRLSIADLTELGLPAITLIDINNYKHFVVIKGVRDGKVLVGDPTFGLLTLSTGDFQRIWSGIVLVVVAKGHQAQGKDSFNRAAEWQVRPRAPVGAVVDSTVLAGWTAITTAPVQVRPTLDIAQ